MRDSLVHEKLYRASTQSAPRKRTSSRVRHPTTPPRNELGPEFWSRFVEQYWEKRPLVIKHPFALPPVTPEETFAALVKASNQYRAAEWSSSLGFYIEDALLIPDLERYLPARDDRSTAGYAERVTRQLHDRRFGLMVENFHVYDAQIWLRLREFLRGLYEFTGIPGDHNKTGLFLGNYEKTPVGLHEGGSSNFKFVIEGRKRLRVWPGEVFRQKRNIAHTHDYERFLDQSIVLEGEPGDLIYWPSGYWHIGESVDGALAVSLSLALFMNPRPSMDMSQTIETVEELLKDSKDTEIYPLQPDKLQESANKLPRLVKQVTEAFRAAHRKTQVQQALQVQWMNRVTGFGFISVPPPLSHRALDENEVVRCDPNYPVVWLPANDDEIICSANGHAFSVTAHPKILKLLKRLNSGEPYRVKQLLKEHAGTGEVGKVKFKASAEDIRVILEKLYSLRAIVGLVL